MTDNSIRKMITHTIDTLPVPWEQLWVIFRRVIQLMRDPQKAIEEKTENQNESKKVIEEEMKEGGNDYVLFKMRK